MLTIKEMLVLKKEYGFSYEYIAEKSGVPLSTVQKVFSKTTGTPRRTTIEALNKAFDERDMIHVTEIKDHIGYNTDDNSGGLADSSTDHETPDMAECNIVCEEEAPYGMADKKNDIVDDNFGTYGMFDGTAALKISDVTDVQGIDQKDKTIDDYIALPEGTRVELIDGVFYDMAAPTTIHQRIGYLLVSAFENYIKSNKGKCVTFLAPTDVQLDCDNKTMVQPDALVVCDRDKITRARIVGAPDLVVEILSESNWYHDMVLKCRKYKNAGVREYWVVVPDKLTVLVYNFENDPDPVEYTFSDKIPVAIWEGKCEVDFKEIYEEIAFLIEK